jgi:hypothetical protein
MDSIADIETDYEPVKRVYYTDSDGRLCARVLMDTDKVDTLIEDNKQLSHEYRPHQKTGVRKVASIPTEMILKWLIEEGVPGYLGSEGIDLVLNKKINDPEFKYFRTVPDNFRI